MAMTIYLRSKLESLSTEELLSLQSDAFAHIAGLAEWDPVRIKGEGILDMILEVLTKRLDNENVVTELRRMFAL